MKLTRCDSENNFLSDLREQWRALLASNDELPEELYTPQLNYAAQVAAEDPPHPHGGVFSVVSTDSDDDLEHHALVHINYAWPRKSLRVVWQFMSPRYVGDEVAALSLGPVLGAILHGAWDLHLSGPWSDAEEIRIFCPKHDDRELYKQGITHLNALGVRVTTDRMGNWMRIKSLASTK